MTSRPGWRSLRLPPRILPTSKKCTWRSRKSACQVSQIWKPTLPVTLVVNPTNSNSFLTNRRLESRLKLTSTARWSRSASRSSTRLKAWWMTSTLSRCRSMTIPKPRAKSLSGQTKTWPTLSRMLRVPKRKLCRLSPTRNLQVSGCVGCFSWSSWSWELSYLSSSLNEREKIHQMICAPYKQSILSYKQDHTLLYIYYHVILHKIL